MKNKKLVAAIVFALVSLSCFISVFILSAKKAEAVPPKLDFIYWFDLYYHCEPGLEDHCWPGSAMTW